MPPPAHCHPTGASAAHQHPQPAPASPGPSTSGCPALRRPRHGAGPSLQIALFINTLPYKNRLRHNGRAPSLPLSPHSNHIHASRNQTVRIRGRKSPKGKATVRSGHVGGSTDGTMVGCQRESRVRHPVTPKERGCRALWLLVSPRKEAVPNAPTHVGGTRANGQDPGQCICTRAPSVTDTGSKTAP